MRDLDLSNAFTAWKMCWVLPKQYQNAADTPIILLCIGGNRIDPSSVNGIGVPSHVTPPPLTVVVQIRRLVI